MVTVLKGPISSHPMYDKVPSEAGDAIRATVPRVRPEAQNIYKMHQGSIANLFQVDGNRIDMMSKQLKPDNKAKDHMRENVRRMRQIQKMSREREADSHKPVKAIWKSEKYKDVTSKVKSDIIEKVPLPPRPMSAPFLRAHSRSGPSVTVSARSPSPTYNPPADRLTVPSASSCHSLNLIHHDIDFIKKNTQTAKNVSIPRSPSVSALDDLKKKQDDEYKQYKKGNVPKYLKARQTQWKKTEEERIANMPDPAMPPGHRVLPESERQETLSLLKKNQRELLEKLQQQPLRTDTLRVRTQKQQLESKLSEVEEAIKIFSRPKVFVKVDGQ